MCFLRVEETQTFPRLGPHNQKFQKSSGIYGLGSNWSGIRCLLCGLSPASAPPDGVNRAADEYLRRPPCGPDRKAASETGRTIHTVRTPAALVQSCDINGPDVHAARAHPRGPGCPPCRSTVSLNRENTSTVTWVPAPASVCGDVGPPPPPRDLSCQPPAGSTQRVPRRPSTPREPLL